MMTAEDYLPLEAIMPQQFLALWTRRPLSPERALAFGVIEQAANDLRQYRRTRTRKARRLYWDAYWWVSSTKRDHAFTFVNLCESLGLSVQAVRARLLQEADEKVGAAA